MRTRPFVAALACCTISLLSIPVLATAQVAPLALPSFASLKKEATDSVDITIGATELGMVNWLIDAHQAEGAELKKTLQGLESVQIRSYRFDADYTYPSAELDALRAQLSQPGWSHLVKTRDRDKKENVDIYLALDNHLVKGVTIIACEPRELTVLNIVGAVDLDRVARLRETFAPSGKSTQRAALLVP